MTSRIHLSSLWVLFSYLLTASLLLAATHLHLEQSGHKGTFLPSNSSKTLGTQSFLTLTDQVNSHSYPSALLLSSGSRALAVFLGPVTGPFPSTPKPVEAGGWLDLKEALRIQDRSCRKSRLGGSNKFILLLAGPKLQGAILEHPDKD